MGSTLKTLTLEEIAKLTGADLRGDKAFVISGVADLEGAKESDIAFLAHPRYESKLASSHAGAVIVRPNVPHIPTKNFLFIEDPSHAFQQVVDILMADVCKGSGFVGIHDTAAIHPSAKIGQNVTIGPHAVIDSEAIIGDNTFIGAGASIGSGVKMGQNCKIHPNASLEERTVLGDRVIIHSGVVIGLTGFGYTHDKQGRHHKLEHYGIVEIGDDVEIGSNTTISRARFQKTTIGDGTKIDCLVEIGHNCHIGKHVIIVGGCAIAGSVTIGDHVWMGGKVAIDSHLSICSGVMIRACSGLTKSITTPGAYGGAPAIPLKESNRLDVNLRNIDKTLKRLQELEDRVAQLES